MLLNILPYVGGNAYSEGKIDLSLPLLTDG